MATSSKTTVKKAVKSSAPASTKKAAASKAAAAPVAPATEAKAPKVAVNHNPGLKTTTKKPLASMSDAHRAHIERWESKLEAIGAEHVWATTPRFKGRGEGPFYLAIKKGKKSYAIVSYDTSKPEAKSKMLVDNITSPKAVLDAFGEYRTMAKTERGPVAEAAVEAAPAAEPTKKATGKAAKSATVTEPAKKIIRKVSTKKAS